MDAAKNARNMIYIVIDCLAFNLLLLCVLRFGFAVVSIRQ